MPDQRGKSVSNTGELRDRFVRRDATVAVIGLGYVGLPLVREFGAAGFSIIGVDVDPAKVEQLNRGESYIRHIESRLIQSLIDENKFRATLDFAEVAEADAIVVCVPTPLTKHREPDLGYVLGTGRSIGPHVRPGQLIVLESTTYPGTTLEEFKPVIEAGGCRSGTDIFIAFSPEREDPGNPRFSTGTIPKVVGGDGPEATDLACALYDQIVTRTVPVSSTATAEAVKLTENIFRSVNIALVNELKVIYSQMGINVWEVIEAAKTKPFGFMAFYPGPGLGGHCIPIDPFYLTWKAREYGIQTRFIELAGEINSAMPQYVVDRLAESLNDKFGKGLKNTRILLVGFSYKPDVADERESPAFRLTELIEDRGASVEYYDPFVPVIPRTREHPALEGRRSVSWNEVLTAEFDAAVICTNHSDIDYEALARCMPLVVDTRNALSDLSENKESVVRA